MASSSVLSSVVPLTAKKQTLWFFRDVALPMPMPRLDHHLHLQSFRSALVPLVPRCSCFLQTTCSPNASAGFPSHYLLALLGAVVAFQSRRCSERNVKVIIVKSFTAPTFSRPFPSQRVACKMATAPAPAPPPAESTDAGPVHYFAIGAMLNPVSLANRKIFPLESRPAELLGHNIHFFGSIGVAEAVVEEGASFHGVLHKVDADTMAKLDKIERDYVKKTATARCYDGTLVECLVYCRPHSLIAEETETETEAVVSEESSEPSKIVDMIAAEEVESELSSPRRSESIVQVGRRRGRRRSLSVSDLRIKDNVTVTKTMASVSSLPSQRRLSLENIDTSGLVIPPSSRVLEDADDDADDNSSSESGSDNTPTPSKHTIPTHCSDQPPLERYLHIMIDGCRHFGVSEEYIDFLSNHESQPRPIPGEFHSFGDPPKDSPTFTLEEVEQCDGRDGRPLRITFCGRVLECSLDRNSRDWNEFTDIHEQVGHVGEIYISRVAYDPKYGTPETLKDFTEEHANYLEDLMWRYMFFTGLPDVWIPVGWFEQTYRDPSS